MTPPVHGAILAGGGATRYGGRPKGLERVGGIRILDLVAGVLTEALGAPPLLVANAPEAAGWRPDLRVVPDAHAGLGALGGLYTAVLEAPAPVVCVAWDMPFVTAPLIRALADGLSEADACLPASGSRRGVEPLCAAYGPACRLAIERTIQEGDLRAIGFHSLIRVRVLAAEACAGDPDRTFFNVNTPDDLDRAEALVDRDRPAPS